MTRAYLDALTRPQLTEMVLDLQAARDADRRYAVREYRAVCGQLDEARTALAEAEREIALLQAENIALYRRLDKGKRRQKTVTYSEEVDFETLSPDEQIAWITLHPDQVSAHKT